MRQVAAAERARSANRSPLSLWVPSEILRWMTGARSARSAGLLVGSTPSIGGEGPERGPDLEQVVGELPVPAVARVLRARRPRAAAGVRSGSARSRPGVGGGRGARAGRRARRQNTLAGELEALLAEGLLLAQPVGVAAEVALEMRPAHLAAGRVEMAVAVPAIRDHDPGVAGADQRVELLAVAVLGDLQERRVGGGRGPQRAALTAGAPAGLIDMHRAPDQHPVLQAAGAGRPMRLRRAGRSRPTAPVESVTPNRSRASSRSRGARSDAGRSTSPPPPATSARTATPAICSGNRALVRARQCRQRNWWVRCSVRITLIAGNSAT